MPIPKYDEIMPMALKRIASSNEAVKKADLEQPLSLDFQLTESEVAEVYKSGNGRIFSDRISWAVSHLSMAGLVERPKRGFYLISELGIQLLAKPGDIKVFVKKRVSERNQAKAADNEEAEVIVEQTEADITPTESLDIAAKSIRDSVYDEIIDTILSKDPYEFERLVVMLLNKMGYGGLIKDADMVTKKSNDGGIDGIIKEDVLGLGRIHIQAKRYNRDSVIGRDAIQNFVGALAVAQSNKGVFITTSSFTKNAIEYANSLNGSTTLVLIDGDQLAEHIYDYGLGMQTEQTIVIKRLDTDFWDQLKEAK